MTHLSRDGGDFRCVLSVFMGTFVHICTYVWQDVAALTRPAFCHCNSLKWGGGTSFPDFMAHIHRPHIRCLALCTPATSTSFWYWPSEYNLATLHAVPSGSAVCLSSPDHGRSEPPLLQAVNVYWITVCFSKQKCSITIEKGLRLVPPAYFLTPKCPWH